MLILVVKQARFTHCYVINHCLLSHFSTLLKLTYEEFVVADQTTTWVVGCTVTVCVQSDNNNKTEHNNYCVGTPILLLFLAVNFNENNKNFHVRSLPIHCFTQKL